MPRETGQPDQRTVLLNEIKASRQIIEHCQDVWLGDVWLREYHRGKIAYLEKVLGIEKTDQVPSEK